MLPCPPCFCRGGIRRLVVTMPPCTAAREGWLYGTNFAEYDMPLHDIVRWGNYTDTVDADGAACITDTVYMREPMEITERSVAEMLRESGTRQAVVESNNGG